VRNGSTNYNQETRRIQWGAQEGHRCGIVIEDNNGDLDFEAEEEE
jgi:hypothetical protein